MKTANDLHAYQRNAVKYVIDHPSCALWVKMGLGKTVITLTAIRDLIDSLEVKRVLIIAPLRVAQHVWWQESKEWEHTKGTTFTRLWELSPKARKAAIQEQTEVHVATQGITRWMVDNYHKNWPYDVVVLDESDGFKGQDSKRFRSLKRVLNSISRVIELTGTPAPNGYLDLWAQIYLLDQGERLGRAYTPYRNRFFESDYRGYNWAIREGAKEEIESRIADLVLTVTTDHAVKPIPRIDNTVTISLPTEARKLYTQLEKDFLLLFEDGVVEAANAAVLTNKLRQVANGAVYHSDGKKTEYLHTAKLDALQEIIDQSGGDPILVAYEYRSDLERIREAFPETVGLQDSPDTVERWNRGEIQLLATHPKSGGHGLNLQTGGCVVVWFGLPWSLGLYQQLNARLHRQGQKKTVIVHHIVAENTVDSTVLDSLNAKNDTQKGLLAALVTAAKGRQGVNV